MKSIVNFIKQVWKISPGYILLIFFNALLSGAKIIFNHLKSLRKRNPCKSVKSVVNSSLSRFLSTDKLINQ